MFEGALGSIQRIIEARLGQTPDRLFSEAGIFTLPFKDEYENYILPAEISDLIIERPDAAYISIHNDKHPDNETRTWLDKLMVAVKPILYEGAAKSLSQETVENRIERYAEALLWESIQVDTLLGHAGMYLGGDGNGNLLRACFKRVPRSSTESSSFGYILPFPGEETEKEIAYRVGSTNSRNWNTIFINEQCIDLNLGETLFRVPATPIVTDHDSKDVLSLCQEYLFPGMDTSKVRYYDFRAQGGKRYVTGPNCYDGKLMILVDCTDIANLSLPGKGKMEVWVQATHFPNPPSKEREPDQEPAYAYVDIPREI